MDYLKELYSRRGGGMKFGLERIEKFIDYLKNPQNKFKSIHVAGTNGKGSVVNIIAKILQEYGLKVGQFISPHLVDYNERIQINSEKIKSESIKRYFKQWKKYLNSEEITFFEITTALGFQEFYENKVDVAVLETGLGGRLDATNVVNSDIAVITAIAHDHTSILGNTLEKITFEKAGIIKIGKPVITLRQDPIIIDVLEKKAKEMETSLKVVDSQKVITNVKVSSGAMSFNIVGYDEKFETDLIGLHQVENFALAVETVRLFLDNKISGKIIKDAIKKVSWKGRFEIISKKPEIIYDVAHNYFGAEALMNVLNKIYPQKKIKFVIGILKNKQILEILKLIDKKSKSISIAPINIKRSYTYTELKEMLDKRSKISIFKNINLAINNEIISSNKNDVICIFGSHYIGEDVYRFKKNFTPKR
ncbi:MAG: folylpolyglutamate synthase/dihydrofolate synthase family protein [Candidatus Marinimicrobia bacterium]|nr:folylpolyglutamate synthase/dihydrofolate synthase family protein [Candidatus Neomarinimicrobiota bacterium]